jgi:hypothetical protein
LRRPSLGTILIAGLSGAPLRRHFRVNREDNYFAAGGDIQQLRPVGYSVSNDR